MGIAALNHPTIRQYPGWHWLSASDTHRSRILAGSFDAQYFKASAITCISGRCYHGRCCYARLCADEAELPKQAGACRCRGLRQSERHSWAHARAEAERELATA